jgi:hypothetical protein
MAYISGQLVFLKRASKQLHHLKKCGICHKPFIKDKRRIEVQASPGKRVEFQQ